MKASRLLAIVVVLILLLSTSVPAFAQLGDTDVSSFTVMNVSGTTATVTVQFIDEDGNTYQPNPLDAGTPNPFTLAIGANKQIYVPNVPGLPSGRLSVMISSLEQVIAIASVSGTGARRFTGEYTGFSGGATTFYLPSFANNYYGWYSLVSVQNLGDLPADIRVDVTCSNVVETGYLEVFDVPSMASYTFVLKDPAVYPTGFPADNFACVGSAKITSDQPVVATDSQNKPANGNTNTFNGEPVGFSKLYVPVLTNAYYGWNHSLNIVKLNSGDTTVTIDYSDGEPNDTCVLTNSAPGCQIYMPTVHPTTGIFGATLTATVSGGGTPQLLAAATSTKGTLSSAYNAVPSGSSTSFITQVAKAYYSWNSSWTCQNVGTVATNIQISYQGYPANIYTHANNLSVGETQQVYVPSETFLPGGYAGSATISALAGGAEITCVVDFTNANWTNPATPGDWTQGYNAYSQ